MQAEEAPLVEASWESILNVALKAMGTINNGNEAAVFVQCAEREGILAVLPSKTSKRNIEVKVTDNFVVCRNKDDISPLLCLDERLKELTEKYDNEEEYSLVLVDDDKKQFKHYEIIDREVRLVISVEAPFYLIDIPVYLDIFEHNEKD